MIRPLLSIPSSAIAAVLFLILNYVMVPIVVVHGYECTFLYIEQENRNDIPFIPQAIHALENRTKLPMCPEGDYNPDTWPLTTGCQLTCPDVDVRTCITYGYTNNENLGVLHMTCGGEGTIPSPPNNAIVSTCNDNSDWGEKQIPEWTNTKCAVCFYQDNCLPEAFNGYTSGPTMAPTTISEGSSSSGASGSGASGGGASGASTTIAPNNKTTSSMGSFIAFVVLSVAFGAGIFVL